MITVDMRDRKPIYEQLIDNIRTLAVQGHLKPDEHLPSVRQLAAELAINPNTIQKAYAELERRGFVYTVKGRGNFVHYQDVLLDEKKEQLSERIRQILQEADELGISRDELLASIGEEHND